MPCLVALIALISPRLAIIVVWLFTTWLDRAYDQWLIPVIGFLLLPWTTLAYAAMYVLGPRGVEGLEWAIVVIAFLADIGVVAGGRRGRRRL
jgi:hypothetical protein